MSESEIEGIKFEKKVVLVINFEEQRKEREKPSFESEGEKLV